MKSASLYHGPMVASWEIRWSDSSGTTLVGTLDRARATLAYFLREGRSGRCTITRTEVCPQPGCDGDGTRSVKRRGSMFLASVPCVGCRGRFETVEDLSEIGPIHFSDSTPLTDVLRILGYAHGPSNEFGSKLITRAGWPMYQGGASSTWDWLRETGQIL